MYARNAPKDIVKNVVDVIMSNIPVVSGLTALSGSFVDQGERGYRLIFKK